MDTIGLSHICGVSSHPHFSCFVGTTEFKSDCLSVVLCEFLNNAFTLPDIKSLNFTM